MAQKSSTWATIAIIILLLIGLALLVSTAIIANNNIQKSIGNTVQSFSANTGPGANFSTPLTGTDANGNTISQVSCPAEKTINIIGAFYQVSDPYGSCNTLANNNNKVSAINAMCGVMGTGSVVPVPIGTCSTSGDCYDPNIFECINNTCQLQQMCSTDADCNFGSGVYTCQGATGGNKNGYCVDKNVCLGLSYSGQGELQTPLINTYNNNSVCDPTNATTMCAIRDASAYIATKCNGQNVCNLTIADFGPTPCSGITATPCNFNTSQSSFEDFTSDRNSLYCQLPFNYGWSGQPPQNSTGSPGNASVNLGYTVHGIYTCI